MHLNIKYNSNYVTFGRISITVRYERLKVGTLGSVSPEEQNKVLGRHLDY